MDLYQLIGVERRCRALKGISVFYGKVMQIMIHFTCLMEREKRFSALTSPLVSESPSTLSREAAKQPARLEHAVSGGGQHSAGRVSNPSHPPSEMFSLLTLSQGVLSPGCSVCVGITPNMSHAPTSNTGFIVWPCLRKIRSYRTKEQLATYVCVSVSVPVYMLYCMCT